MPKRIYNPIMAMGFLAMFTLQLDNTNCRIPIAVIAVVDTLKLYRAQIWTSVKLILTFQDQKDVDICPK
jgi:hypothetical protein